MTYSIKHFFASFSVRLAVSGLLATGLISNCIAAHSEEISFGVISVDTSNALKSAWQPFFDDMAKATGLTVKGYYATDYAGIIEGMRFNKVQVAWYGNKSAMEAVDRSSGEIFAKITRIDGSEGYNSILITNQNSKYKTLEDFLANTKEINFGIGDPNSTSGTLIPTYYIFSKNKINPKTDFKTIRSANHTTNLLAVANNQVDVATNNTEDMERVEKNSPEIASKIRVLWKSPLIPSDPFVYRKDLPAETKMKIKDFMLGYGKTKAEKDILNAMSFGGIKASNDDQLLPIRQLAVASEIIKLENDSVMGADDKAKKMAELKAKLSEIEKRVASVK